MQSGVQRDSVSIECIDLNLKSLKDLACNFVDRKFPDHGLTRLPERLMLFRHDYSADVSSLTERTHVIELVRKYLIVSTNLPVFVLIPDFSDLAFP